MSLESTRICTVCQSPKTNGEMATDDVCSQCVCSSTGCTDVADTIVEYEDGSSLTMCMDCADEAYGSCDDVVGVG